MCLCLGELGGEGRGRVDHMCPCLGELGGEGRGRVPLSR